MTTNPDPAAHAAFLTNGWKPVPPPCVLRVGVAGHRRKRLVDLGLEEDRVREVLSAALHHLRETLVMAFKKGHEVFANGSPVLRLVSAAAEGTDTIACECALREGLEVDSILPFLAEMYLEDFVEDTDMLRQVRNESANSDLDALSASYLARRSEADESEVNRLRRYVDLVVRSRSVLELGCPYGTERVRCEGYELAGRMILRHSDVLIVIWDGSQSSNPGGTDSIFREAAVFGVPVIWINTQDLKPTLWVPVDGRLEHMNWHKLSQVVEDLLLTSDAVSRATALDNQELADFFVERSRSVLVFGASWKLLRSVMTLSLPNRPFRVRTSEPDWERSWKTAVGISSKAKDAIDLGLRQPFLIADTLAAYYREMYRSAVVVTSLLAAMAVMAAMMPIALGWFQVGSPFYAFHRVWYALELAFIFAILGIWWIAQRQRWHKRYVDYRLLAENLRILRYMLPLGRVTSLTKPPAYFSYADPSRGWVFWLLRSIARHVGIVPARLDSTYVEAYNSFVREDWLAGQIGFHKRNQRGLKRLNANLRRARLAFFLGTAFACMLHLVVHDHHLAGWLTLAVAGLPAIGGAIHAIDAYGNFEEVEQRSVAMVEELEGFLREIASISDARELGQQMDEIAQALSAEALIWRAAFLLRPVALPS